MKLDNLISRHESNLYNQSLSHGKWSPTLINNDGSRNNAFEIKKISISDKESPSFQDIGTTSNEGTKDNGLNMPLSSKNNEKEIISKPGLSQDTPKWLSKMAMVSQLSIRLTDETYNDLINRLNILYPIQDKEVKDLLKEFIPIGKALDPVVTEPATLDEFNRSFTTASRKRARAQIWLVPGMGQVYVNGQSLAQYFPRLAWRESIIKPFEVSGTLGKYNVWAEVSGGGFTGQADAIQTATARGISIHDQTCFDALKSAGLIDIDRRQVERKKTGQPKARKKNTWVKR